MPTKPARTAASVKPVYALVGPEPLLQVQALADITAQLPPDTQRVDLDGDDSELSDLLDHLHTFSLFGGHNLVVLRQADDFLSKHRPALEDYVQKPSAQSTLVLRLDSLPANQRIHKMITAKGAVIPCQPPKDLARWVVDRARSTHRTSIEPAAAAELVNNLGNDMGRLDNELAKLAIACPGGIDQAAVEQTVPFQRERQMWDMTDALGSGQPAEALRRWRQLLQMDTSAEFRGITWLGIFLQNARKAIAMTRQGDSPFTIGQQLRIWPQNRQAAFVQTALRLGDKGVDRLLDLLVEIDYQGKTGIGDAASNVERFLLSAAQFLEPAEPATSR
ncbi:MAG: DNA polymerase III subunit delta [Tepidisphaeraceae bacterium]